ncbi:MAG: DUF4870 domain-containing protein [Verrucomicrobiota bacterium]
MSDQDTPPPMGEPPAGPEGSTGGGFPTGSAAGGVTLGQGSLAESDEKMMGLLAHILGIFASFVGPLIIWLIKKDQSPFVDDQGKEALNFQITIAIAYVVFFILTAVVQIIPVVGAIIGCVGAIALLAVGILMIVYAIIGGMKANEGVAYRYPFAFRFVK